MDKLLPCSCGASPVLCETYDTLRIYCPICGRTTQKYFGDYEDEAFMWACYGKRATEEWNSTIVEGELMEELLCDRCGRTLRKKYTVHTRFLSPDCKKICEYGQICERCYADWIQYIQGHPEQSEIVHCGECSYRVHQTGLKEKELIYIIAERNEAMKYIPRDCTTCRYWRPWASEFCIAPGNVPCEFNKRQAWVWRGPQKEDGRSDD